VKNRETSAIFALLFALVFSGCDSEEVKFPEVKNKIEADTPQIHFLKGPLNKSFLVALDNIPEDTSVIGVNSVGGDSIPALKVAKVIQNRDLKIIIDGEFGICASGCAEYLLPAAKSLKFNNEPLVGYHQNPHIIYSLLKNTIPSQLDFCTELKQQINEANELYSTKNLNQNFWSSTLEKIEIEYFQPRKILEKCPSANWQFKHELWFPNSKQLKELLGLKFEGAVCSDAPEVCKSKIDETWDEGLSFVVGDELYVSKGKKRGL